MNIANFLLFFFIFTPIFSCIHNQPRSHHCELLAPHIHNLTFYKAADFSILRIITIFAPRNKKWGSTCPTPLLIMIQVNTNTFRTSILSGIAVGIAGWGYLACTNIIGAVLFSFGLLTVVNYKLPLYTGTAGFVPLRDSEGRSCWLSAIGKLLFVLLGNITGCLLVALLTRLSPIDLGTSAQRILEARLAIGPLRAGLLAIGCGFIMTTVVTFAREGKVLTLLFGVPLFINCGFPHCLADAFYYLTVPTAYTSSHLLQLAILYPSLVIGNFIGCNLYRFIAPETK